MSIVAKYTIVVIEGKPDYFIVKCGNCNGHGCSACNYYGKRKLNVPSNWNCDDIGIVKCGNCNGHGCSACNYVGAYVGCFPRVVCGNCNGHGCSACNYRGSVWVGNLR